MIEEQQKKQLHELFIKQRFAVIATQASNEPYTSLVAFSSTEDLSYLIFATLRQTRKYENIRKNAKISMLIDNRENLSSDIKNAIAVTVVGNATEIIDNRQHFMDIHLEKHPYLKEFLQDANCALVGLA
ncbi:MAG TPA: pyridoxamine 5'-phosphate oxidase family protein, partial [Candidatus Thermoplasmatota archaeon]|nr:pyridoxamine 5'-phosphate oxidase family protein [Candidatus Thermoplasmatota archaeon]